MKEEHPILKKAREERPELFKRVPFVEDAAALAPFGILIPGKESFPPGYLKRYPEDFIVEEVGLDGKLYTIDRENLLAEAGPVLGEGDTVYATLVKCGVSTLEVAREISRQTGIDVRNIGYSGIKDKHAITSQLVSIRGASEAALKALSSSYFFLKDAYRGKGMIKAGDLRGNRFTIYARMLPGATIETIGPAEETFFNYFYLQRFASPRYINYEWGYDILRGDYEKAVESLLFKKSPREIGFVSKVRAAGEKNRSWSEIRSIFEPVADILLSEKPVIDYLAKRPGDYAGALLEIPDQVQLWLYALASLLFNEKISGAIRNKAQLPEELPFFLSDRKEDIELYAPELRALGIFPPPFENLRPFRFMRLSHRTAQTLEKASDIRKVDVPGGIIVSFNLSKGSYATTFLSHHINIVSEAPLEGMSSDRLDGAHAGGDARARTLESFKDVSTRIEA
ncbi:MAG TPA: tRNA pseudouridine(13) synthase TruD [Candidatus Paceibacterota bacterium]|nr:tRNA pseudouridine(13) synthase TruD [Candidatus Paceibacterota bacterium]